MHALRDKEGLEENSFIDEKLYCLPQLPVKP